MDTSRWMRGGRWLLPLTAMLVVGCNPPPPTVPTPLPDVANETVASHPRWTFDLVPDGKRLPAGWSFEATSPAGDESMMDCACRGALPKDAGGKLGGDYWKAPFQSEAEGCCWITTGAAARRGKLRSPPFRPFARYLHLRVRSFGGEGSPGDRIELYAQGREEPVFSVPRPAGDEALRWDLQREIERLRLPHGERTRFHLRLVDEGGAALGIKDVLATDEEKPKVRAPVWGVADLHAHFLSQIGFGGALFHGRVHSGIGTDGRVLKSERSDPTAALSSCSGQHAADGARTNLFPPEWNHGLDGSPEYTGWPRFDVVLEQQTYIDWILRAHEGGLRLVQVDVLNSVPSRELVYNHFGNVVLRGLHQPDQTTSSDAWNIEWQANALQKLVDLPDVRGRAEIATSADEARRIVAENKLALVLGVEVDDLGELTAKLAGLQYDSQMRPLIRRYVTRLRALGVSHLFPTHLTNNGLGSAAIYDGIFAPANAFLMNEHFRLVDGRSDGIYFRLDHDMPENALNLAVGLQTGRDFGRKFTEQEMGWAGHRNAAGLTRAGWILLEEAARAGMLIDADHMSEVGTEQALCFGESIGYPVMFSHTGFRELGFVPERPLAGPRDRSDATANPKHFTSERSRTRKQVERVRALGGILGVGTGKAVFDASRWRPADPAVARRLDELACDGSSVTFARHYLYALEAAGGQGVALGTDVNGFSEQLAPRFGPFACVGALDRGRGDVDAKARSTQIASQRGRLRYASECRSSYPDDSAALKCPLPRSQERLTGVVHGHKAVNLDLWQAILMVESGQAEARWRMGPAVCNPSNTAGQAAQPEAVLEEAAGLYVARADRSLDVLCPRGVSCRQQIAYHVGKGLSCDEICTPSRPACGAIATCRPLCESLHEPYTAWLAEATKTTAEPEPLRKSVLEKADFDFNIDGLAHYGLLPDMLQDLRAVGLEPRHLAALFRSTEDYLRMWEIAEERSRAIDREDGDGLGRILVSGLRQDDWLTCGRPPLP